MMRSDGVVIVGGGLAGSAAAAWLARAGGRVRLFEREAASTDKVCGEFLSAEAQQYLTRTGLDLQALGGHPISQLRLVRGGAVAVTALPFRGLGLSRRRLDDAMLDHATANGADVLRGCDARLSEGEFGAEVEVARGRLAPAALLLATGKHDSRALRRRPVRPPEELIGFKTYFRLDATQHQALTGSVEVIVFPHGYAGLQRVENGRANLCLLTHRRQFEDSGSTWPGLLDELMRQSPHLRRRLSGATPLLERPLSIYRVPYGFVHAPHATDPQNVYRLGDQMAVIASFTGDGMAIALHSAALAVQSHLSGSGAGRYHDCMRTHVRAQVARAGTLYRLGRTAIGQATLVPLARACPRAVRWAAQLTRVPAQHVDRTLARL